MASPKISHLILNTANYEAMKQWYLDVFEAKIGVETSDHSACFLQMDESHHRIGMFNVAKTDESPAMTSPGAPDTGALSRLNHFAFEYPALPELFQAYRRLAGSSILPAVSLNHGPTMSIYYQDPDRNIIELDDERKAAMVSNLLVVLCGERGTQPIVNTGTLYN